MRCLVYSIIFIRSILFYIFAGFFLVVIVAPVGNVLALFAPVKTLIYWLYFGGTGVRVIFNIVIGVRVEFRGLEHIISGPCIIASKHQAAYETFMLYNKFFHKAAYVIKAEFGKAFFYLALLYKRYDGIKIRRQDGVKALIKMEKQAIEILRQGRQVVIFPEGTRAAFGKQIPFKRGVERIYEKAKVPVVPVAVNSGAVMPKGFMCYPGKIIIEFLPVIQPGLTANEFMKKLETNINNKVTQLEAETKPHWLFKGE